jgi:hypothetical protein
MVVKDTSMNTHKSFGKQRSNSISRRLFLRRAGAAGLGFSIIPRHVLGQGQTPPSEKLDIAGIGVGNQGGGVLRDPAISSQNIVALSDVDWKYAAGTAKTFPNAERFNPATGFREVIGTYPGAAPRSFRKPAGGQDAMLVVTADIPRR